MHRLFLPPDQFLGETARILGPDHLHLARVLRACPGEQVTLLDNAGRAFLAVVEAVGKDETTARIIEPVAVPPEPSLAITVAQALGKGDKFEQVIQHGTEAGASVFLPVRAERSVVDIPADRIPERLNRWRQIAKGAAEQSGRGRIPEVLAPMRLTELLRQGTEPPALRLLLHPGTEASPLRTVLKEQTTPPERVILLVGPEGGWSPAEVSAARAANSSAVSLGPRILRTETAALVAISQLLYKFETT